MQRCEALEKVTGETVVIESQEGNVNSGGYSDSGGNAGTVRLPANQPTYPTEEGRAQATPEEVLNHELNHQNSRMDGTRAGKKSTPDKQYGNKSEKEAIESTNKMKSRTGANQNRQRTAY